MKRIFSFYPLFLAFRQFLPKKLLRNLFILIAVAVVLLVGGAILLFMIISTLFTFIGSILSSLYSFLELQVLPAATPLLKEIPSYDSLRNMLSMV